MDSDVSGAFYMAQPNHFDGREIVFVTAGSASDPVSGAKRAPVLSGPMPSSEETMTENNNEKQVHEPAPEVVAANDVLDVSTSKEEPAIEQPAKLLRIAVMVRELLEEVRRAPVDESAREHLRTIHQRVVIELKSGLSGALREELDRLALPLAENSIPSESEIRIAQAQLLGWLEGLFQGIQAAIATQQMAAQAQLEEMRRRGLPPGAQPGFNPAPQAPGQYL
ncbi:MAG: hypothetical protein NVSMB57_03040 [Actinomycetota bacterium]